MGKDLSRIIANFVNEKPFLIDEFWVEDACGCFSVNNVYDTDVTLEIMFFLQDFPTYN
jgi:hypothetical protein